MAGALLDAQVDLNPHQIDAAMFATSNPLSRGAILADEVGLGKTIEAGLLIAQRWAERKRNILVIVPANLRKQWHQELSDKFGLAATILEAKSFKQSQKAGSPNPFNAVGIVICSYQFAAGRAAEVQAVDWDLVVIDDAHIYRLGHPLAQALLDHAKRQVLEPIKLVLDYASYGSKVSLLEPLRGRSGWLTVQTLRIESLGAVEEHLLLASSDTQGNISDAQITDRLLSMPCVATTQQARLESFQADCQLRIDGEVERQRNLIIAELETRNLVSFTQEADKLDAWPDDLKVGLEREIKELDRAIREARTKSKGAATLADKLAAQKEQRSLEGQRDNKRRELFDRQDDIQRNRDGLIDELERQLKQTITVSAVMTVEWELQ